MRRLRSGTGWTASVVLASVVLASCVPRPEPTPAPTPAPAPPPPAAPVATPSPVPTFSNWIDAPATPGDWSYANGTAVFGETASGARLTLRCDRAAGVIRIARAGEAVAALPMIVRTEFMERGIDAVPVQGAAPSIMAQVAAHDPLLDAMAFSKGRFAVEIGGLQTLYVPSYPEVTRVIEDCR